MEEKEILSLPENELIKQFRYLNERTLALEEDLTDDDIVKIFKFVFDIINRSTIRIREKINKEKNKSYDYNYKPYPISVMIFNTTDFCIIVGRKTYKYTELQSNDRLFCEESMDLEDSPYFYEDAEKIAEQYFSDQTSRFMGIKELIKKPYINTYIIMVFKTLIRYLNVYSNDACILNYFSIGDNGLVLDSALLNKKYF